MKTGFIGLGNMGAAMALNMARSGTELIVWNRTQEKSHALANADPRIAVVTSAADVFEQARTVILMLANSSAIDAVLERSTPAFAHRVRGHTIVHMGTTAPDYSAALEADIHAVGGAYVEAPVSGSRGPAEQGKLIGMLAGERAAVALVEPLLQSMCDRTFLCGAVPQALRMKLAVNLFLITMVTGLAEASNFARHSGVDLAVLRDIIDAGPMASKVSAAKLSKLVGTDYAVQASIADVLMNCRLIVDAARAGAINSPLIDHCRDLFARADELGHGQSDMIAVILAFSQLKR